MSQHKVAKPTTEFHIKTQLKTSDIVLINYTTNTNSNQIDKTTALSHEHPTYARQIRSIQQQSHALFEHCTRTKSIGVH